MKRFGLDWTALPIHPLLAAAYFYVLARRKKAAVVYGSLAVPRAVWEVPPAV